MERKEEFELFVSDHNIPLQIENSHLHFDSSILKRGIERNIAIPCNRLKYRIKRRKIYKIQEYIKKNLRHTLNIIDIKAIICLETECTSDLNTAVIPNK